MKQVVGDGVNSNRYFEQDLTLLTPGTSEVEVLGCCDLSRVVCQIKNTATKADRPARITRHGHTMAVKYAH